VLSKARHAIVDSIAIIQLTIFIRIKLCSLCKIRRQYLEKTSQIYIQAIITVVVLADLVAQDSPSQVLEEMAAEQAVTTQVIRAGKRVLQIL